MSLSTIAAVLLIASSSQPTTGTPQLPHQTVQATTLTQPNKQTAVKQKHQTITPKKQKHQKGKPPCNQPRGKNH